MTQSFTYDGAPLLRTRSLQVVLTQSAELMAVGTGRIVVNDTAGTQAIVGQKDFTATQDDCPQDLMGRWFVGEQSYRRGVEKGGAAREIAFSIEDLNSIGGFLSFNGTSADSGDRPEETVDERMAWLDDNDRLPGVTFGSRVASSSKVMDAANYGDQTSTDVIAACALAADGFNAYIRDFGSGPELVFRNDNTSIADTSTIVISNRLSDIDLDTVFPPLQDFELVKRPGRVGSWMHFSYADGKVIEKREATEDDFNGRRDLTASDANIKDASTARDRAQDLLWQHHTEERIIEGSILLPPEKVNLLAHGDRVGVRLQHLNPEGFYDASELVYCRVLEVQNQPKLKPTRLYELRLKLSPQEAGPPPPGDCVDLYANTPSGTYYPLGGVNITPGAHPFASDGVVHYFRGGLGAATVPDTFEIGSWHFGVWGAGGLGTIDWAGDCTGNILHFITSGNGTWNIQTEMYGGSPRNLYVRTGPELSDTTHLAYITSGDSIEVTIDDATDGDCIRCVIIGDRGDICGGKWGWSQGVWLLS